LGVSALGINCSLGPSEMVWMVKKLSEITDVDLIVKPNAGLPDMNGKYNLTPEEFSKTMGEILELGVKYIGGCCGTDERFIRNLSENFKGQLVKERTVKKISGPSSGIRVLKNSGFKVVGERLNPTGKKRFQEALREENMDFFVREAISQVDAGADILDVNVGFPGIDEAKMQAKIVKALQSVIDTPLQIDSTNPEALESALRVYNG
ncbi:MAG: homocysteine S-methyltransferase family protein, partial [Ezakiella sp.]